MTLQKTIKEQIELKGTNVYTGRKNRVIFHPSKEDTGLVFLIKNKKRISKIPADLTHAVHKRKGISIEDYQGNNKINAYLTEHVLSAVYAAGINNLLIELPDRVCPTRTDSVRSILLAMMHARIEQDAKEKFWMYPGEKEITLFYPNKKNEKGSRTDSLTVQPAEEFFIKDIAYYPHKTIGWQECRIKMEENEYMTKIMGARSSMIIKNPLIRKAFVALGKMGVHGINEKDYLLIGSIDDEQVLNSEQNGPRYDGQEFVRHKMLDAIGTLALTGRRFMNTEFTFSTTGHAFDLYALRKLFASGKFKEYEEKKRG